MNTRLTKRKFEMKQVTPKTYLIGYTGINMPELYNYLHDTKQGEFLESIIEARKLGLSDGEILCSFYAKLCYKSLVLGTNANVKKIRDINDNFETIISSGHGAVLEHVCLNFVTTNCSRVFTHELVRHRVGTAFSQSSGRYIALGVDKDENPVELEMIIDPLLEPAIDLINEWADYTAQVVRLIRAKLDVKNMTFDKKKKATSAIRRLAPNGQANEIGFSLNLRTLRHTIEQRTSRHAEWEIRLVYNQVAEIVLEKWPHILFGHQREFVENAWEYRNLKV